MATPQTSIVTVLVTTIGILTVNFTTAMLGTKADDMTMGMAVTTIGIVTFLYYGIGCEHDSYHCYYEYYHYDYCHLTF